MKYISGFSRSINHGPKRDTHFQWAVCWKYEQSDIAYVFRFGIGWNKDLPFRPWPAIQRGYTEKGFPDVCLAWFGFYVGLTKAPVFNE